ncbi:MAG: cyclic pyranopterin monophosphate synthase MoaC, partial [Candidatus Omnitrophota bacterium]
MNKPLSMVDVSRKKASSRRAVAVAEVRMQKKTAALIRQGRIEKGDVFSSATLVGILAAKKTPQLIPLCHP